MNIENLKASQKTNQLFLVLADDYDTSHATFYYYKKEEEWQLVLETPALIGQRGMGEGKEGARQTPIGEYTFGKLMGIAPDPGTKMDYHQITEDDYWCGEQYYNKFVDEKTMDHSHCTKENDEHLIEYTKPYEYTAFFNYNKECIKGKGSAYFFHCFGTHDYTMGCVALHHDIVKYLFTIIDEKTIMIIDSYDNLNPKVKS